MIMNLQKCRLWLLIALLVVGVTQTFAGDPTENATPLKTAFKSPPDSARPGVYWYFMDGNLDRKAMTADLEAMKEAGIGNVIFLEVNVGVPRGKVDFMSDQWQDLFVHAVREAERLGIEITLGSGPGWSGSGGPWVQPQQAMQHLVFSEVEVSGPQQFNKVLPVPKQRSTVWHTMRSDFYEDVATFAFPACKPAVANSDEKALYVRDPYTSKPGVRTRFPTKADYAEPDRTQIISPATIIDLSNLVQADGRLAWNVPEGEWTILRMGRRPTGATSRPAPLPGIGLECDKFDAAAFDAHFDQYIGKLLKKVGPRKPNTGWTMLHIDSWEMGAQNWTPQLSDEFKRRRGYDMRPYLPAFSGRIVGSLEKTERFLWDLRMTCQELVLQNHAGHLKKLAHQHGFGLSIEPYDMNPTSDLDLGAVADVPMCEFWSEGFGFDSSFSCFEAVSIAHTGGRPIIAAEAFTAGSNEAWKLYPALLKNQGDWAFGTGINRFVYHTFAHKPNNRRPGMTMGPYGVHWDRGQTWWPMASAYHRYITRCQFLLRQGVAVADICYLAPEGVPHIFVPSPSALVGTGSMRDRRGYNFDGCSPNTLIKRSSVKEGFVRFEGGTSYRLLVLPSAETMTPALLKKITALVESGATVIGSPPHKSPSLVGYPQCDKKVASLAKTLWGETSPPESVAVRQYKDGKIVWGGDLQTDSLYPEYEPTTRLLAEAGVPPDFESEGPVRYTHRRTKELEIYFVSNRSAEVVDAICTFRVTGRKPELWDPISGEVRGLPQYTEQPKRTIVPLRFEPHQSFFIVFQDKAEKHLAKATSPKNFHELQTISQLEGPWELSFDSSLGGPRQAKFAKLEDWSKRSEPGIKHYSGIATYRKIFEFPNAIEGSKHPTFLDLGVVHSMARVRLNGHDLGVVWTAPWRVEITNILRSGGNKLEIEVANLWPNRLIGDLSVPAKQKVTWTTFNPYTKDSPLLPSGLLGPIRIVQSKP